MDEQVTTPSTPAAAPHGRKMVFALRDGALAHIRDVPNGRSCDCTCPACGAPLEAVNGGRKRIHHFRHAAGSSCAAGYETALHLAGKEALMRLKRVMLPEHRSTIHGCAADGTVFAEPVHLPARMIEASETSKEQWLGNFRPDVLFASDGHQLIIEIRVTHAVDEEKLEKIRGKGISAMEIDLSRISTEVLQHPAEFDRYLVSQMEVRQWLFSRKLDSTLERARERLQSKITAHNAKCAARLQRQQRKASSLRERRAEARKALAADLEQLKLSQDDDRAAAREALLAARDLVPSVSRYKANQGAQLFTRVKWDWAFKASSDQWQACVLDLLFPGGAGSAVEFSTEHIEQHLVSTLGVPGFILRLRHQVYLDCQCRPGNVLTIEETARIPRLNVPVELYLKHLAGLGLVVQTSIPGRSPIRYLPRGRTIDDALEQHQRDLASEQQRELETKERFKRAMQKAVEEEAERRLAGRRAEAERLTLIRASELWIYEEHDGRGLRCDRCYLMAGASAQRCPYCGGDELMEARIDAHRLSKNRFMLATSTRLARSVNLASGLDSSTLQPYIDQLAAEAE